MTIDSSNLGLHRPLRAIYGVKKIDSSFFPRSDTISYSTYGASDEEQKDVPAIEGSYPNYRKCFPCVDVYSNRWKRILNKLVKWEKVELSNSNYKKSK